MDLDIWEGLPIWMILDDSGWCLLIHQVILDKQKLSGPSWTQIKSPLVNIIPVWCQPNNPGWILKSVAINSSRESSKKDRRKWSEDCGETLVDQVVVLVFTTAIGQLAKPRHHLWWHCDTHFSNSSRRRYKWVGFAGCGCQRAKLKIRWHIPFLNDHFCSGSSTCPCGPQVLQVLLFLFLYSRRRS